jgi:integrase
MLTGCRVDEIGGLRWEEVDFTGKGVGAGQPAIVISGSRTKNGRTHTIPMTTVIRTILEGRPRGDREYVFGRGEGFTGWSVSKAELDQRLKGAVADWVHHDLRRTTATKMADLGISPHVIEACLNHVSGHKHGVAGIYNRSDYAEQKARAFPAWEQHILKITEGGAKPANVVALRAS